MLGGLGAPLTAVLLFAGLLLDALLGEPRRLHPLVGFGCLAVRVENLLNRGRWRRLAGALAWALAVLPPVCLVLWLQRLLPAWAGWLLDATLLWFSLGLFSLRAHTAPIADALLAGRLSDARALTARIVSRDTDTSDEAELAKAACESQLENGSDAVIGALFWFALAGGAGALLFRLANTLDAMWGYRNARFGRFGSFAARADDVLGYLPARLTALAYALLGDTRRALACWRKQAPAWLSPNAGPVMSSGAGALGVALGGTARYDGVDETRPSLGEGRAPKAADIGRAWRLVARSALLWCTLFALAALITG